MRGLARWWTLAGAALVLLLALLWWPPSAEPAAARAESVDAAADPAAGAWRDEPTQAAASDAGGAVRETAGAPEVTAPTRAPQGPVVLAGQVVRQGSGEPLREVGLVLWNPDASYEASTDGEGRFRFVAVEYGSYRMMVGDGPVVLMHELVIDGPREDLRVEAPAGRLEVYVEAYDPAVLEGAVVRLVSLRLGADAPGGAEDWVQYLAADLEQGVARFPILPTGVYRGRVDLRADADGAPDVSWSGTTVGGGGQWSRAQVQVAPPVTVRVHVVSPYGEAVGGAAVHVHGGDRLRLAEVGSTAADGWTEAQLRERGYPQLSAYADRASGWLPLVEPLSADQELRVVVQQGVDVEVVLVDAGSGSLVTTSSRSLPGLQLVLRGLRGSVVPLELPRLRLGERLQDERWPVEIGVGALLPGRYLLQVVAWGERLGQVEFTVPESWPEGQALRVELAVDQPESIVGGEGG